ncbi:MAG: DUF3795 domain-containing protein [Anaerolineae bacterium]
MIESRCGVLCSACEYREPAGCAGCIEIRKPFWGDRCPVKACCEHRELAHCALCEGFPCDVLIRFAYDPEQGDDGRRIQQCRGWRLKGMDARAVG